MANPEVLDLVLALFRSIADGRVDEDGLRNIAKEALEVLDQTGDPRVVLQVVVEKLEVAIANLTAPRPERLRRRANRKRERADELDALAAEIEAERS